jgi:4-hydroxy-tetrahydrodipicolinate synthase
MDHRPEPPFGEVLTAVLTPFDDNGAVDYATFWRLVKHLADNGSDGIVVAGTTGESPTLSHVEKVALFKAAVEAVGERIKVIAGTGTYDTKVSIELTEQAAEAGCHGVMAVTPYYSKPPQEGLFRHFSAIADATDLPVLLYNIPGRTARLIEIETLVRLAEHPRVVAVKDAVDDHEWSGRAIGALPNGFAVYSGSDAMTKGLVEMNGVGVVSVAAHLAGPQIKRMVQAITSGDGDEAQRLHDGLSPLFAALFLEPNPMPLKAGVAELWGKVGRPRLPLIPASDETKQAIADAMAIAQDL